MRRKTVLMAVIAAMLAGPAAVAQTGQFPGVPPPVPGPAPPAIAPGPAAPQAMPLPSRSPPIVVQRRGGPPVEVPRGRNDSFGDRATSCVHAGTAAGVRAGEIGSFTRDCVNQ